MIKRIFSLLALVLVIGLSMPLLAQVNPQNLKRIDKKPGNVQNVFAQRNAFDTGGGSTGFSFG